MARPHRSDVSPRDDNAGFKAGKSRFLPALGAAHDLAVTLDADSFIPASAILRMVRIMQAAPEIGILQGLCGRHAVDLGLRPHLQFGMRLAMWFLHHRQRLVASRLRPPLGATIRCCA